MFYCIFTDTAHLSHLPLCSLSSSPHPIIVNVITLELKVFWPQTRKLLCTGTLFYLFITFMCWSLCLGLCYLQFISHLLLLLPLLPPRVSSFSSLCFTSLTVTCSLNQLNVEQAPSDGGFSFLLRWNFLVSEPEAFRNSSIVI